MFVFKLIAVFAVILFFVIIEIAARFISPLKKQSDELLKIGDISFFSPINHKGERFVKVTSKYGYNDQNLIFREKKYPNTYRIFCIGGSASAGWPHPMEERFTAYLQKYFETYLPNNKVEIINCGAHGFASYRIQKVFEALLNYSPDAVIVWSGNNEFLEERKYLVSNFHKVVDQMAGKFRTVQLINNWLRTPTLKGDEINVSLAMWKKVQRESLTLRSNPKYFEKVKQHYSESLEKIAKKANEKGIKTIFFTVPVNLKDWEPNVSYCSLTGNDSIKWSSTINSGKKMFKEGRFVEAKEQWQIALQMEPLHAHTWFWLGNCNIFLNDSINAYRCFSQARDLDYNPFRALSGFNKILKEVASNYQTSYLYDADSLFRVNSSKGIPDFDLFLDYVHPSREGNVLLAKYVGRYLIEKDIVPNEIAGIFVEDNKFETVLSNYRDEEDVMVQITRFSLLCLTHQYESAVNLGNSLLNKFGDQLSADPLKAHEVERIKDAIEAFSNYLLAENEVIDQSKSSIAQNAQSSLDAFYKKYFAYGAI